MPPSCSLVSAYGPSVVATLPFFQYRVTAVSGGWRGTSATRCPLARRWSLYSKHSSNVACRSSSVILSNFPGSMYPKQMYFIVLLLIADWRNRQQSVAPARSYRQYGACSEAAVATLFTSFRRVLVSEPGGTESRAPHPTHGRRRRPCAPTPAPRRYQR